MKPVPPHVIALGSEGTEWFGGSVDRSTMTLRVMPKEQGAVMDREIVNQLLGCPSDKHTREGWRLHAPEAKEADLDQQVAWILARVTDDLEVWRKVTSEYRVDLFVGLFLERPNRGVDLSPQTMAALSARGITLGLDIYAPGL